MSYKLITMKFVFKNTLLKLLDILRQVLNNLSENRVTPKLA